MSPNTFQALKGIWRYENLHKFSARSNQTYRKMSSDVVAQKSASLLLLKSSNNSTSTSSSSASCRSPTEDGPLRQFDTQRDNWTSVSAIELSMKSHVFDAENFTLRVLDQLLLPHRTEFVEVRDVEDGRRVIKNMQVRGAPLIATVGMLALIVDLRHRFDAASFVSVLGETPAALRPPTSGVADVLSSLFPIVSSGGCQGASRAANIDNALDLVPMAVERFVGVLEAKCERLMAARPTAVNLANVVGRLRAMLADRAPKLAVARSTSGSDCNASTAADAVLQLRAYVEDFVLGWQAGERVDNDRLLRNSIAVLLPDGIGRPVSDDGKLTVMTICNTGSLATSSFGTALGVIVHLHRLGALRAAVALETRPYLQGARLTAYELAVQYVPFVLIGDGMAAAAMATYRIDAVLVGADQLARNGDTANKIGTYMLAVLARHHRIPFYVVTPAESINARIADGSAIHVEERPARELLCFNGVDTAPAGTMVWNPAFDVTPAALLTGILTERGNFRPAELAEHFPASTAS